MYSHSLLYIYMWLEIDWNFIFIHSNSFQLGIFCVKVIFVVITIIIICQENGMSFFLAFISSTVYFFPFFFFILTKHILLYENKESQDKYHIHTRRISCRHLLLRKNKRSTQTSLFILLQLLNRWIALAILVTILLGTLIYIFIFDRNNSNPVSILKFGLWICILRRWK